MPYLCIDLYIRIYYIYYLYIYIIYIIYIYRQVFGGMPTGKLRRFPQPGRKLQDLDFSTKVPFILIELTGEAVGDCFGEKKWQMEIDSYRYV